MYDVIILGLGPAGLSAALYCARYKLKTLIIGELIGGMTTYAHKVENYPGIDEISGMDLIKKMHAQLKKYPIDIKQEQIIGAKKGKEFVVKTKKDEYRSKAIIFAAGTERKKLNLPGAEDFIGKGLSYCAICDAPLFKNKVVVVIGGSDAAVMDSIMLSQHAKKVYLVYRRKELRAEPVWIDEVLSNKKIEVIYDEELKKIIGSKVVEKIKLNRRELEVSGVFVDIGSVPSTVLIKKLGLKTDKCDYIITDANRKTNVDGVFAAGDCIETPLKQIITACADGAIAATSAFKFLKRK
ncbi:MAG: FAD-dependent oxidoreductase [archaeon]